MTLTFFISANIISLVVGFLADLVVGDPSWRYHPVRVLGNLIAFLEKRLYRNSFMAGLILVLMVLFIIMGAYLLLLVYAFKFSPLLYIAFSSVGVWVSISVKDMSVQLKKVYVPLSQKNLGMARQMLSLVVSRDTKEMQESKIVSSAIETIGENYTDAVVSPIFYSALFGGTGAIFFKIVSTFDSMVGYRNDKYEKFGKFAARLDDIMGFIPARLSIVPIVLGAIVSKQDPIGAYTCFARNRHEHPSPNSAHGISAFAGALGVKLGGATSYGGVLYQKPVLNGGDTPLEKDQILRALQLYRYSSYTAVVVSLLISQGLLVCITSLL